MGPANGNTFSVRVGTHRKAVRDAALIPAFSQIYICTGCFHSHFAARCDRSVRTKHHFNPAPWCFLEIKVNVSTTQHKRKIRDMAWIIISQTLSVKSPLKQLTWDESEIDIKIHYTLKVWVWYKGKMFNKEDNLGGTQTAWAWIFFFYLRPFLLFRLSEVTQSNVSSIGLSDWQQQMLFWGVRGQMSSAGTQTSRVGVCRKSFEPSGSVIDFI